MLTMICEERRPYALISSRRSVVEAALGRLESTLEPVPLNHYDEE